MKRNRLVTALLFVLATTAARSAQAQHYHGHAHHSSGPMTTLGRHLGLGWSDGYHATPCAPPAACTHARCSTPAVENAWRPPVFVLPQFRIPTPSPWVRVTPGSRAKMSLGQPPQHEVEAQPQVAPAAEPWETEQPVKTPMREASPEPSPLAQPVELPLRLPAVHDAATPASLPQTARHHDLRRLPPL